MAESKAAGAAIAATTAKSGGYGRQTSGSAASGGTTAINQSRNVVYGAFSGVPSMTIAPRSQAPSVDIPTVGRVASGVVFIVCAVSLLIGELSGFYAIFPPMSLLVGAMGALLYVISVGLERQWKK